MSYIERKKFLKKCVDTFGKAGVTIKAIEEIADKCTTPDVVEVVRCKDCKYLHCLSAIDRQFYCNHFPHGLKGINIIEDNPYCSYGERRANET